MSSFYDSCCACFGRRRIRLNNDDTDNEREPLLPVYKDDTERQRRMDEKLHTYLQLRALSKGFMPSTDQTIANLRTLLSSDLLNTPDYEVSDSGRLLIKYMRQALQQFIDLLKAKNSKDQIQDFIWYLTKARITVDAKDLSARASKVKARADTLAAYESLRTIGTLVLGNPDFRMFLHDLQVVGREIFRDSAFKLSEVANETAKEIAPPEEQQKALAEAPSKVDQAGEAAEPPTKVDLLGEVEDIGKTVGAGAAEVGKEVQHSAAEHFSGAEKDTLLMRLRQTVVRLRQRPDYEKSVSTISLLVRRYAKIYSRAAEESVTVAKEDIHQNEELEYAVKQIWSFIRSFGDAQAWDDLEKIFKRIVDEHRRSPDFEHLMDEIAKTIQQMLLDPEFFNNADNKFAQLIDQGSAIEPNSPIRRDIDEFAGQARKTLKSIFEDADIAALLKTATQLAPILSPDQAWVNQDLMQDTINAFLPALINAVQVIPIPRLEVSTPEIDLLLENLFLEPGTTVNNSSFLPFRLRFETKNDVEIRKARVRVVSTAKSITTIKIDGMSVRAEELGFWMRAHAGLLRFGDAGIANFSLDERGIDIAIEVEVGRDRLEHILSLKSVKVNIHKLDYTLRKSRFACIAWFLKPFLRPILRKVLEKQVANAISDGLHAANRELLYARERLRATRIADPDSLLTFFKAIAARLTPEEDPDLYTRLGIDQPGKGVFKGVYAPGSVVKKWHQEAMRAGEVVEDYDQGGWRNAAFDVEGVNAA